jgi:hypothetical protein
MVPKYPNLLSANRGDARSFRHSIWPKCVRSPRVKRYSSFATLFRLLKGSDKATSSSFRVVSYLTLESPLSSLKLALMAALSFCTTARSSAIVFEARTLRMNCFTTRGQRGEEGGAVGATHKNSCWQSRGRSGPKLRSRPAVEG